MTDKDKKETTLYTLAREAVNQHHAIEDAVDAVLAELASNEALMQTLFQDAIRTAVQEAVYSVRHTDKATLKRRPNPAMSTVGLKFAADSLMRSMLDGWRLPDGRVLGDAKGIELQEFAEHEQNLAVGHQQNATFYMRVAQKAGRKLVRNACDDAELRALWENIAHVDDAESA